MSGSQMTAMTNGINADTRASPANKSLDLTNLFWSTLFGLAKKPVKTGSKTGEMIQSGSFDISKKSYTQKHNLRSPGW